MKLKTIKLAAVVIVFFFFVLMAEAYSSAIKDSESATHGDEASSYQIVDTYEFPDFKLLQINLAVLSHYSYMLVSEGDALIVDPGRDVQFYIDTANSLKAKITGIFLTHSHADFVAGHMELVSKTGCPVYQSGLSNAEYLIEPIKEGTTLTLGKAKIVFMDTPGHVIDGTSALVYSEGKTDPEFMLSGDYLFVGSVGRPDLVTGTTSAALASAIFDTWVNKVSKLPASTRVFPAHGAGSLCGAHLRDAPFTTIGEEQASNPFLQHKTRSAFVTAVLNELSEPPQYFGHNAAMNRLGPPLLDSAPAPQSVEPDQALTDIEKFYVIDIRDSKKFAEGHVPNSVNIGLRGRFETWTGIMVPWGANVVVCGDEVEIVEALHRLQRVGYTARSLQFEAWKKAGNPVLSNTLMPPEELYAAMEAGSQPIIVDVRLPSEWMGLRIGTVLNLPLNKLAELSAKLNPEDQVVAVCNSAYRSTLAIGILERKGFTRVTSLDGGSQAWIDAGYPVYGAEKKSGGGLIAQKVVLLPERICANELNRMLLDLPGTFELVDIRPPAMFHDYNIEGSVNTDISELMSNPAYLAGAGPLVIVDRDGSLAMAVAGILSQKTKRNIKALYGGLEAYWNIGAEGASSAAPAAAPPMTPASPQPQPKSKPAAQPNKKSAGC